MHKITYSHPLPAGKGAGGIGAGKQVKAGLTGGKAGTPPRAPQWQCRQATKQARPPPGTADTRRAGNAGASPPIEFSTAAGRTSAARVQPRGCKGRSPLHKITYSHPLPHRGRGARKQVKGRVNRRQSRHAPRRVSLTPAEPATPGQAPIEFSTAAGRTSAARVQPRGCKGRSPLHKITYSHPLPHRGRGAGG